MEEEKKVVPTYVFSPAEDETDATTPVRRQIAKTMPITENFTLYGVYSYMAQIDKKIKEFEDGIVALQGQKKNYEDELLVIEEALGVSDMESEFQKLKAAEAVADEAMKQLTPDEQAADSAKE